MQPPEEGEDMHDIILPSMQLITPTQHRDTIWITNGSERGGCNNTIFTAWVGQ